MANSIHIHSEKKWLERLGFSLSILCTIHCLAMPFIIALLPIAAGPLLDNIFIESLILGSSMVLASFNIGRDYLRYHKKSLPLIILGFAIAFLLCEIIFHTAGGSSHYFAIAGGLLVFSAYLFNWNFSKKFHRCEIHTGKTHAKDF